MVGFLSFTEDRKIETEQTSELPQRHFFVMGWGKAGMLNMLSMLKILKSLFIHFLGSSLPSGTQWDTDIFRQP